MSDYLYIGKVINTHGIKGEIRLLSDFLYKDRLFKNNNYLYIDEFKYKIISHRVHKNYDMVLLEGINNIDEANILKNKLVYAKRSDILKEGEFVLLDLVGFSIIYFYKNVGKVNNIEISKKYNYLVSDNNKYIPYIEEFINKVDINDKCIYIKDIEGLL